VNDILDEKQVKKSSKKWIFNLEKKDYFMNLIKKYKNIFLANYSFIYLKGYFLLKCAGIVLLEKLKTCKNMHYKLS